MKRNLRLIITLGCLLGLLSIGFAQNVSLGEVADNVIGPMSVMRHLLDVGSIILGVIFLMNAYFRWERHRKNPQESLLSTVILLVILGLILIVIPLIYMVAVKSAATVGAHIDSSY